MVQNLAAIPIPNINMAEAELEIGCFKDIPISAMSPQTRRQLSILLNSRKYLPSEGGYCRDWRGIATLTDQKDFFDESAISGYDPTSKVLNEWYKINKKEANFANLQRILGLIDRWDASDDIYENLVEDAKNYKIKLQNEQTRAAALAARNEASSQERTNDENDVPADSDLDILTIEDARLAEQNKPPQIYDAFLLYVDCDAEYAAEIKRRLEEDNKYKLCTKDDIVAPGTFMHKVMTRVIDERCNRLIVILTKEFRKSPEKDFYMNHAQAGAIESHKVKLIPLVYDDDVEIPNTLKHILHLRRDAHRYWERLAISLRSIISTPKINQHACPQLELSSSPSTSGTTEIPSINITPAQEDELDVPQHFSTTSALPPVKETRYTKKQTIANGNYMINQHSSNSNGHINKTNNNTNNNNNNNTINKSDNLSSKFMQVKGFVLRHAHSTSQLNAKSYKETNVSSSDVSISSHCSETPKLKKKKKLSTKFLKRVFSRSNQKLQTAV